MSPAHRTMMNPRFYVIARPLCLAAASILAVCTLAAGTLSAAADDASSTGAWPAWRRDGSGTAADKQLPVAWSDTQNVLWRTELPGEGNSSPIVCGGRVFLTAALDHGAKRLVLCLDAASGKRLWTRELLPGLETTFYPKTGFAASTPAGDAKRVYVFFDEPGLVALDMQGQVVWTRRLGPFNCPYNMGTSPMLYKDTVIQCCDHRGPAFLAAFDRTTGAERWRTAGVQRFRPLRHAAVDPRARRHAVGRQRRAGRWPTTPTAGGSSGRAAA